MTNVGGPVSGGKGGGMPKLLIVAIVILLVLIVGCCGGVVTCRYILGRAATAVGNLSPIQKNGEGFTIKTGDGEVNLGGGSLPASFPKDIVVYEGMKTLTSVASSKDGAGMVMLSGKAKASDVQDFYEKQMPAKGWTETGNTNMGDGSTLVFTNGDREASVMIVPSGDDVTVQVTYGKNTSGGGGAPAGGGAAAPGQEGAGGGTAAAPERTAQETAQLKAMRLPTNFPTDVPLYTGMVSTYSLADNKAGSGSVILQGKADRQAVVDFYTQKMKDGGWTESANTEAGDVTQLQYTKEGRQVTVQVSPGDNGMENVMIVYEKK